MYACLVSNIRLTLNSSQCAGKSLKDVFATSPMSETGSTVEFEEPLEMDGKLRWQIIRVLSEGVKGSLVERSALESGDSSRPSSQTQQVEDEEDDLSSEQTELVYANGMYLSGEACLKELRNAFVDSDQLEESDGLHFQFLQSDVPGDRIELDTEDEVLLCQIEDSLVQRRTLYIECIDPGKWPC